MTYLLCLLLISSQKLALKSLNEPSHRFSFFCVFFVSIGNLLDLYFPSLQLALSAVFLFCVEVLRPSQPIGVISSTGSLPNHTFTGQA